VFEDDTDVHMVMELCEGPSLTDAVAGGKLRNEQDIAIVLSSILRFIAQCHGKGLVYRDVKPDNFLFVRNEVHSPLNATDFGLSIRHRSGESPLTSRSGTPAYMAPEVRQLPILSCQERDCTPHALPAGEMHTAHAVRRVV
jgi:calcium-dependent protein kinase